MHMIRMVAMKVFSMVCFVLMSEAKENSADDYPHSASFASGNMKLYWKTVEEMIEFELHGKTQGWIGVGLSNHGGMAGADIIVGWVKDSEAYITDRHGIANQYPLKDDQQDVELISGQECNGWTVLKFRRPLAACESDQDKSITRDTMRVIWAYGSTDPTGDDLDPSGRHSATSRGSLSLILVDDMTFYRENFADSEDTKTVTFTNDNLRLPPMDTYYHCTLIKIPKIARKHHVIRARPVITKGNELTVHHLLLMQCGGEVMNPKDMRPGGSHCYDMVLPEHFATCNTMVAGFAIGGTDFYFPEEAGYPIGGEDDSTIFQLQIHYDNPLMRDDIIDSSGFELTYTEKLREFDTGMMMFGNSINGFDHFIPPKADYITTAGHCSPECLTGALGYSGVSGIKVFGALLHTHTRGKSVNVRHIRNGTELPPIASDMNYDFNYQEIRFKKDMPEVLPTDYVTVECGYDTSSYKKVIMGGLGIQQEMCVTFLFYYPKIDLKQCTSNPMTKETYPLFDISTYNITGYLDLSNVLVTSPEKNAGKNAMDIVNEMDWNDQSLGLYSSRVAKMTHLQGCEGDNFHLKEPYTFRPPVVENPHVEREQLCENTWKIASTSVRETKCSSTSAITKEQIVIIVLSLSLIVVALSSIVAR